MTKSITECAFLKHGNPIPDGWELSNTLDGTHHCRHAVLIKKIYPESDKQPDKNLGADDAN